MQGSILAEEIDKEYRTKKYYARKRRRECKIQNCKECKYIDVCEVGEEYETES